MRDSDADRAAHQAHLKAERRRALVTEWLRENPEIGALSSGQYYIIKDGQQTMVAELERLQ